MITAEEARRSTWANRKTREIAFLAIMKEAESRINHATSRGDFYCTVQYDESYDNQAFLDAISRLKELGFNATFVGANLIQVLWEKPNA